MALVHGELTEAIIRAGLTVHSELGPGLLEKPYEICLYRELEAAGVPVERQVKLPVHYRGVNIDCSYSIDLLVDKRVVVEVKAVDRFSKVHEAQLLSYLKLSGCRVGLLINFKVARLKEGIRRLIHG